MALLTVCHVTTELWVPVWCCLGTCQTEPRNLQPIPCAVLSNTASQHLRHERSARAMRGRCDLSGCHMWISSLEACESLGSSARLNPPPFLGHQVGRRRNIFSDNKHVSWPAPPSVPPVSVYKNVHRFCRMDERLAKVRVRSAIAGGVIGDWELSLWEQRC